MKYSLRKVTKRDFFSFLDGNLLSFMEQKKKNEKSFEKRKTNLLQFFQEEKSSTVYAREKTFLQLFEAKGHLIYNNLTRKKEIFLQLF